MIVKLKFSGAHKEKAKFWLSLKKNENVCYYWCSIKLV